MKRIILPRFISLNTICIYIALFCVSSFALLEHSTVTISAFSPIKLYLMYVGFICVVTQIKTISRSILKKKYFYILLAVVVFCMFLGFSMLGNANATGGMPLYNTVRFVLFLLELYALVIILAETGRGKAALKFLFWYALLIALVNDALMFSGIISFGTKKYETYIVGTKFAVAYLHMDLLTLWLMVYGQKGGRLKGRKWAVVLVTVFLVAVSIRTDCKTGLLGCIILATLFELLQTPKGIRLSILGTPGMLVVTLAISVLFIFVVDGIVSIPAIRYLIEEVFRRDASITGRTNIYQVLMGSMNDHWLHGYGYGNDYETAMQLFGYANVQNGLMHWVFQIGIPATLALLAIFVQTFRQVRRSKIAHRMRVMPMVILVYVYIVLATIETTFNMMFIMWFALIYILVTEQNRGEKGEQV